MRFASITLTCLCMVMTAVPVLAKDKKAEKQMDPQAMMEAYAKLATPGEPHSYLQAWPVAGRQRPSPGWNPASPQWNQQAPGK